MAHNRYVERGGEDGSTDVEISLLREHGCLVDYFERDNRDIAVLGAARAGLNAVWSQKTYRDVRALLRCKTYDIVHVQNFFPLISPAIYYAADAEGVPVVQTVHNYRLVCPGANLLREGQACEKCIGKPFAWPGVVHGCYRGSSASTAAVAAATSAHRLAGTWRRKVSRYIALTEFSRSKLVQGGLPGERIAVKPNFIWPDPGPDHSPGEHFLYVGRLSEEKGLDVLLDAWEIAGVDVPLLIAGSGPEEARLKERCSKLPGVRFLGQQPVSEVYRLAGRAFALCFPSLCYENFPRTILEAFAVATPVIALRHGSVPEIVTHAETGMLAPFGDAHAFAGHIRRAASDPALMTRMGHAARETFEARYTAAENYRQLMSIYAEARHDLGL